MIIKVKYEQAATHVTARIFMGPELTQLTLCGTLMFTNQEFLEYVDVLKNGSILVKGSDVYVVDASDGSSGTLPKIRIPRA